MFKCNTFLKKKSRISIDSFSLSNLPDSSNTVQLFGNSLLSQSILYLTHSSPQTTKTFLQNPEFTIYV